MSKGIRTTRKSGGQPHFENVVVRWTTRLSALIMKPVHIIDFCLITEADRISVGLVLLHFHLQSCTKTSICKRLTT